MVMVPAQDAADDADYGNHGDAVGDGQGEGQHETSKKKHSTLVDISCFCLIFC